MRPESIVMFERLFFVNLALGLVGYFVNYDAAMAQLEADPGTAALGMGGGFMIGSYLVGLAINLLLWYFTARRGSNVARWIFTVLMGIGLVFSIPSLFVMGLSLITVTTIVGLLITLVLIVLLFRPDSSAWFTSDGPTDPEVFS